MFSVGRQRFMHGTTVRGYTDAQKTWQINMQIEQRTRLYFARSKLTKWVESVFLSASPCFLKRNLVQVCCCVHSSQKPFALSEREHALPLTRFYTCRTQRATTQKSTSLQNVAEEEAHFFYPDRSTQIQLNFAERDEE